MQKILKTLLYITLSVFVLQSCGDSKFKIPGGDARKFPADPEKRIAKNLEEGRGFQLNEMMNNRGGVFEFASSNELWRASLDVIDFMPLNSVNYSGGIIITDWYSSEQNSNESIKISIRFLSNEIRADALDIKIFNRKCNEMLNCKITETQGELIKELNKKILKTATLYGKQKREKKKK